DELKNFRLGYYDGLTVEFIAVESRQAALELLCNAQDTAVLVDAFTYIAAENRCGAIPAFQVEHERSSRSTTFELVVNTRIVPNLTNLTGRDRRFCAESLESDTGFIYPALALRQYNIDLLDADTIEIVTDGFENDEEMVRGLAGGANQRLCESAALPAGRFEEILNDLPEDEQDALEDVGLFTSNEVTAWPSIPNDVLVFSPLMPEFLRTEIINAITAIVADNRDANNDLQRLFGYEDFVAVTPEDFADFRAWLQTVGWNMTN
ncbi:MAG: PhnD/SsuA/transferrin family substrate-binding protein, partial [Anaerolineae bacterium]|nr:PhnD/SsuA/transferrin family substrate-binding protein [Anaerolineae bacterium]